MPTAAPPPEREGAYSTNAYPTSAFRSRALRDETNPQFEHVIW